MKERAFRWWNESISPDREALSVPEMQTPPEMALVWPKISTIIFSQINPLIQDECSYWKHVVHLLEIFLERKDIPDPQKDFSDFVIFLYSHQNEIQPSSMEVITKYVEIFGKGNLGRFFLSDYLIAISNLLLVFHSFSYLHNNKNQKWMDFIFDHGSIERIIDLFITFLDKSPNSEDNQNSSDFQLELTTFLTNLLLENNNPINSMQNHTISKFYSKILKLIKYSKEEFSITFLRCAISLNEKYFPYLYYEEKVSRILGLIESAQLHRNIITIVLFYAKKQVENGCISHKKLISMLVKQNLSSISEMELIKEICLTKAIVDPLQNISANSESQFNQKKTYDDQNFNENQNQHENFITSSSQSTTSSVDIHFQSFPTEYSSNTSSPSISHNSGNDFTLTNTPYKNYSPLTNSLTDYSQTSSFSSVSSSTNSQIYDCSPAFLPMLIQSHSTASSATNQEEKPILPEVSSSATPKTTPLLTGLKNSQRNTPQVFRDSENETKLLCIRFFSRKMTINQIMMRACYKLMLEILSTGKESHHIRKWFSIFINSLFCFFKIAQTRRKYTKRVFMLCSVLSDETFFEGNENLTWVKEIINEAASCSYSFGNKPDIIKFFFHISPPQNLTKFEALFFKLSNSNLSKLKYYPFKPNSYSLIENVHQRSKPKRTKEIQFFADMQNKSSLKRKGFNPYSIKYVYQNYEKSPVDHQLCIFELEDFIAMEKEKLEFLQTQNETKLPKDLQTISTKSIMEKSTNSYPLLLTNELLQEKMAHKDEEDSSILIELIGLKVLLQDYEQTISDFLTTTLTKFITIATDIINGISSHPHLFVNQKLLISDFAETFNSSTIVVRLKRIKNQLLDKAIFLSNKFNDKQKNQQKQHEISLLARQNYVKAFQNQYNQSSKASNTTDILDNIKVAEIEENITEIITPTSNLSSLDILNLSINEGTTRFVPKLQYSPPSYIDDHLSDFINSQTDKTEILKLISDIKEENVSDFVPDLFNASVSIINKLNLSFEICQSVVNDSLMRIAFNNAYNNENDLNKLTKFNKEFLMKLESYKNNKISDLKLRPNLIKKNMKYKTVANLCAVTPFLLGQIQFLTNPLDISYSIYICVQTLPSLVGCSTKAPLSLDEYCELLLSILAFDPPSNAVSIAIFLERFNQIITSLDLMYTNSIYRTAVFKLVNENEVKKACSFGNSQTT